ncbi:MAG: 2'-5' RNA ligase family protein [Blastochloris sp.]|nr:2'-5' RNA ligase family protein [Blastochloris sp.]
MAATAAPIALQFAAVGAFPGNEGVVFLSPVPRLALLHLHQQFHTVLEPLGMRHNPHYLPGMWIPHCTIAIGVPADQVAAAVAVARHTPLPLSLTCAEVGIVRFRPVEEIQRFRLCGV